MKMEGVGEVWLTFSSTPSPLAPSPPTPFTRAMENTLQLMNSKNERYRKSLHRVDGSSEEVVQLEGMEGQLQTIQGKLRHRRKQAQQLTEDLKVCPQVPPDPCA